MVSSKKTAEEYWFENTQSCPELPERRTTYGKQFREKNGAIAWIEFIGSEAWLKKIEKLPSSPSGAGKGLLKFILDICNKYNLTLKGNAEPYDPYSKKEPTREECDNLKRWYESCGVIVRKGENNIPQILYAKSYHNFLQKMTFDEIASFIKTLPKTIYNNNLIVALRKKLLEISFVEEGTPEETQKNAIKLANSVASALIDGLKISNPELLERYAVVDKDYLDWLCTQLNRQKKNTIIITDNVVPLR